MEGGTPRTLRIRQIHRRQGLAQSSTGQIAEVSRVRRCPSYGSGVSTRHPSKSRVGTCFRCRSINPDKRNRPTHQLFRCNTVLPLDVRWVESEIDLTKTICSRNSDVSLFSCRVHFFHITATVEGAACWHPSDPTSAPQRTKSKSRPALISGSSSQVAADQLMMNPNERAPILIAKASLWQTHGCTSED